MSSTTCVFLVSQDSSRHRRPGQGDRWPSPPSHLGRHGAGRLVSKSVSTSGWADGPSTTTRHPGDTPIRQGFSRFSFFPDNIWAVTKTDEVERVRTALGDLCEPLHDAFHWAEAQRYAALPELDDRATYGWHATHTVRALAHYRLDASDLGGWALTGNHARNGELWLTDGQYRARVLHALSDRQVPPPERTSPGVRTIATFHWPCSSLLRCSAQLMIVCCFCGGSTQRLTGPPSVLCAQSAIGSGGNAPKLTLTSFSLARLWTCGTWSSYLATRASN
jgi:hypothetical protein